MDDQPTADTYAARHALLATLNDLLDKLNGRAWGSARGMQMDAGAAINLLYDAQLREDNLLTATLSSLIRELGQRRPDTRRHILTLQGIVDDLTAELGEAGAGEPPPS